MFIRQEKKQASNGFYSHHMNKSSLWCFLIKQKIKRNSIRRLEAIVGNGLKSDQIHQTPGAKTDGDY